MINKRLGSAAVLFVLLAFHASASTVSLLLVETGLGEETAGTPYSSLWEGGLMAAFFDAGHIVTNSPISRMEKKPVKDLTGFVETDFNEAVSGGADYFILGFLDFRIQGGRGIPVGIALKVYSAVSHTLIYEQSFPAGRGKDLDEEYKNAQIIGQSIISHLKDR